jgi:archaellum biogenesis ATPase FlaH
VSLKTFADFYALGYTRLVPVIPHDAEISPTSSLFKRVGTGQDGRGKVPGVRGADGKWFSFDWTKHEADELDCQRWQRMGAGVGVKMGGGLYLIDADTLDPVLAGLILTTVVKHFGILPTRIGNWPKAGYLIRLSSEMKYTRVDFGAERVEILGEGRFAVFQGTHPKTLKPYTWTVPLVPFDKLPVFSPAQVVAFLEELRTLLPAAKPLVTEGVTTEVSQVSLRGSLDKVRKAVAATPNTSTTFGTREAYRDYGYAIRAALPNDEPAAFEIFSEWCARWEDGTNDPDIVAADWRRMRPPYRRGANWIYELAEQHAPEAFRKVDAYFDVIDEPENLFNNEKFPPLLEASVAIKWVDPAEWEGATRPVRRWIVGGMIPDGEVTLLTGAGGVGKTLLAQQLATCVSQGRPFLGRATIQSKVMLFLCEDSEDELQLRQRDINLSMGLDLAELSAGLRITSRKFMDNLLAIWTSNSGAMKRTKVWEALRDDAVTFGAKLIVIDTIADTFGGNEIDRSHVRQFVQACLGKLAQETGGAVLALGHPSKAGQAAGGDGTSGSTAWHASVRSRLYLQHAAKDQTGPYRKLQSMKSNYGAGGDVFMLRWLRGAFDLMSAKILGPDEDSTSEANGAPGAVVSAIPSMGNVIDDAILAAVAELSAEGVPLSKANNSPHWAPRVFKRQFDALGIYMIDDIEAGWIRVLKAGRVRAAVVGRKPNNRMPIVGFVIALPVSAGVFD